MSSHTGKWDWDIKASHRAINQMFELFKHLHCVNMESSLLLCACQRNLPRKMLKIINKVMQSFLFYWTYISSYVVTFQTKRLKYGTFLECLPSTAVHSWPTKYGLHTFMQSSYTLHHPMQRNLCLASSWDLHHTHPSKWYSPENKQNLFFKLSELVSRHFPMSGVQQYRVYTYLHVIVFFVLPLDVPLY